MSDVQETEISGAFSRSVLLGLVVVQYTQEDIDVQIKYGRTVPARQIGILVDATAYALDSDEIEIGTINQYLEKDYGVSRIGNVRVYLTNTGDRYSEDNPASLIADKDFLWTWIRIRCGWGPDLETDIATQFQGKLYELITTDQYVCVLSVYDPVKDLMDWEITADITFNAALVAGTALLSLNPLHIIKYLIEEVYVKNGTYGLKWYNFDTSTYGDIIDTTSFDLAYSATIHTLVSDTLWEKGSNLLEMIQDLLKIVGGYMFTAPNGKLKFYVPSPERSFGTVNAYTGNIDSDPRQLYTSSVVISYEDIFNEVIWEVGPTSRVVGPFSASYSIGRFGKKTKELKTRWEIADASLELLSDRLLARFSEPYQKLNGELSYIEAGTALTEELGNVVSLTDRAHFIISKYFEIVKIGKNLPNESIAIETRDASTMTGKFMIACSEVDQGDGYGITADNFDLWIHRFGFAGRAYSTDPHYSGVEVGFDPDGNHNFIINPDYGTQDRWGNGIEEIFVAW